MLIDHLMMDFSGREKTPPKPSQYHLVRVSSGRDIIKDHILFTTVIQRLAILSLAYYELQYLPAFFLDPSLANI